MLGDLLSSLLSDVLIGLGASIGASKAAAVRSKRKRILAILISGTLLTTFFFAFYWLLRSEGKGFLWVAIVIFLLTFCAVIAELRSPLNKDRK